MNRTYRTNNIPILIFAILWFSNCDDFVRIDSPRYALVKASVFDNDATANAAVLDIYYQMRSSAFASGTLYSISFLGSLISDEQVNYYISTPTGTAEVQQFNDNALAANNSEVLRLWTDLYSCIYKTNAVIEGLAASSQVSESKRKQLEGEAKFVRAFCHFYLVNLWGDVPLILTTDYRENSEISRTSSDAVYQQITDDLINAQDLLLADYSVSNNERVRPNKGAVMALLARVYLYKGDWKNAEATSTRLIDDAQYNLVTNLKTVNVKNNSEAIWQLWSDTYPNDLFTFYIFSKPRYAALRDEFVNNFETSDQRKSFWIGAVGTFLFSKKYSSFTLTEYSTVLRLAEQYIIRAEARAQLDNITGAQIDLNTIRTRANLDNTMANDKPSLLIAIEQERRSELFAEWGHRWLDLKRTKRTDAILGPLKPQWVSTADLFPIPESEIINNAALRNSQNPGY